MLNKGNKKKSPIIKSIAGINKVFFVHNIANKCFCVSNGNLEYSIGDGKARFSIASDYKASSFSSPSGIFESDNLIYISDTNNHCIRQLDIKNKKIQVISGSPLNSDTLDHPTKLTIKRNMIFVLDGDTVKVTGLSGASISEVYKSDSIDSIEADDHRNVYIIERENG